MVSDSESEYEELDDRPTAADINRTRESLSEKCSSVNDFLLSSREPVEKRRLIEHTMQDLLNAFNQMAANYLRVNAIVNTTAALKGMINNSVKREVTSAVQKALTSNVSYASVASGATSRPTNAKVKVMNGPTVTIPRTISVVVGPKKDSAVKFTSAEETCRAIVKAVKPVEVGLKVNKLVHTRNNAVRIIADSLDVSKLKECPSLAAAGLEIKERERLNPRLIIRDVPTDLSNAALLEEILSLNLDTSANRDIMKIVYRYPSRRSNGLASVVIETDAATRNLLLRKGRINLNWRSCKIEDHLRVLQCYKCQDFGHLAKNCSAEAACGNCAGPHETSACSSASSHKCVNCVRCKISSNDHKAFDAAKCPVIKRRLTEKAKNIAY